MKKYLIKSSRILAAVTIGVMLINCSSDSGGSDPVVPPTPTAPAQKAKFTVTISAGSGGAVSTTGGTYEQGQTVSVTATPQGEYIFSNWSDGNTNATRTITVSSNTNLTANFELRKYPLTVNIEGEGEVLEVIVSSGRTTDYDSGTTVKLTAVPAEGWKFGEWTGVIESSELEVQILVNEAKEVNASFIYVDPPTASMLSFPEDDKVCQEGTSVSDTESSVNFQWEASENTTSYDLIINDIEAETSVTYSDITETNKDATLVTARSYSWQIVSKSDETSTTATSELWQFYLAGDGEENYAPYPASIISPASGSTVAASEEGLITLKWSGEDPDEDTLTYTVYIDTVDGLQDTNGTITGLTETETTYEVTSGSVYYWRVKSSDGQSSSFTQVFSFRVE